MSEFKHQALSLMRKASEDLYAATRLGKDSGASLWTVGFHAQQAVEKALKAVLIKRGIRYPFTHDIKALIELLNKAALPLPPHAKDLPYLTPFGTLFRYEDEEWGLPESVNLNRMLDWAETTVAWARSISAEDDK
jgi:HEPN domain-containing protein